MEKTYTAAENNKDFEAWWDYYPKKKSKGDARKAWDQTKKIRPPLPRLIKAVIVQRASTDWIKDEGKYIPYPATWLRDERWEDVEEVDIASVVNGKAWHETVTGIDAKAKELGMVWKPEQETYQQFAQKVKDAVAAEKVVPLARQQL